jgi:hypothetical protein
MPSRTHDEERAPLDFAVIVDLDDVRVVEVSDVLDFVLESRAGIFVPRELRLLGFSATTRSNIFPSVAL